jgi:ComF family protein
MLAHTSRRLASSLLDLALPPACPGCGAEGELLCDRCGRGLRSRLGEAAGVPFGLPAPVPLPLVQLEWCGPFTGALRAALHQLKYGGERRLARPLGAAMAARWREAGAGGEMLVPVPVHPERARQRGYDQAALLAEAAAAELGIPCCHLLRRARHTTPQFELGRRARLENVTGAFALVATPSLEAARGTATGRWIVLVDDVATTGATLSACATELYAAGAAAVAGLTVARER